MKLTELTLLALQTAFMQKDLTTQGMCQAVQGHLRELATSTYSILMYQSLNTLGDTEFAHNLVDELAWQFHCDWYDKSAPIETKVALVKQSIKMHQTKGTPQAVIDLLNTAFPSDTILLEWFDYDGEPFHFKIMTSSLENELAFRKALSTVKNARSVLDSIDVWSTVFNYARNNITRGLEVHYKPSHIVGEGLLQYTFQNGETYALGDETLAFITN
jgi:phage tail P2-like protein